MVLGCERRVRWRAVEQTAPPRRTFNAPCNAPPAPTCNIAHRRICVYIILRTGSQHPLDIKIQHIDMAQAAGHINMRCANWVLLILIV